MLIGIAAFFLFETLLRQKYNNVESANYRYTIDYFHPFLQSKLSTSEQIYVNSHGFRSEEISVKKGVNTYRIAVLGGSTVLNREVSYEKNAVRILEKMLQARYKNKKIEVINGGKDWYTSEHSAIQYLFDIKDFKPDMVIMWHGVNDLYTSCTPSDTQYGDFKRDYSHSFGAVAQIVLTYFRPQPIVQIKLISFDLLVKFLRDNFYSDITTYMKQNAFEKYVKSYMSNENTVFVREFPSIDVYRRNLITIAQQVKNDGVVFIVGNQPSLYKKKMTVEEMKALIFPKLVCIQQEKYYSRDSLQNGMKQINSVTESVAREQNIPFINLDSKVPKTLEYFLDSVHYTEKGNMLIAEELFTFITKSNFIK